MRFPSGDHATAFTDPVCPRYVQKVNPTGLDAILSLFPVIALHAFFIRIGAELIGVVVEWLKMFINLVTFSGIAARPPVKLAKIITKAIKAPNITMAGFFLILSITCSVRVLFSFLAGTLFFIFLL